MEPAVGVVSGEPAVADSVVVVVVGGGVADEAVEDGVTEEEEVTVWWERETLYTHTTYTVTHHSLSGGGEVGPSSETTEPEMMRGSVTPISSACTAEGSRVVESS